jgi:hypothetical protein
MAIAEHFSGLGPGLGPGQPRPDAENIGLGPARTDRRAGKFAQAWPITLKARRASGRFTKSHKLMAQARPILTIGPKNQA